MGRSVAILLWVCLLAACANSETRSTVSKNDLRGTRYQRIAVFVEDSNPATPAPSPGLAVSNGAISLFIPAPTGSATDAEIEQKIVSGLKNAGIASSSGPTLFQAQKLSDQAKASIIQKNFDAVLYVTVLTNGMREEFVSDATCDGQQLSFGDGDSYAVAYAEGLGFSCKGDGSVWRSIPTFQAKCDLQDTKTNKVVWSSETIATGGTPVLLSKASEQIVGQLRADGAI